MARRRRGFYRAVSVRVSHSYAIIVVHRAGPTFLLDHRRCPISLYEAIFGRRSRRGLAGRALIFRRPGREQPRSFNGLHILKNDAERANRGLPALEIRPAISSRNIDRSESTDRPFNGTQSSQEPANVIAYARVDNSVQSLKKDAPRMPFASPT